MNSYTSAANFWREMFLSSLDKTLVAHEGVWDDLTRSYTDTGESVATAVYKITSFGDSGNRSGFFASVLSGAEALASTLYNTLCETANICGE